MMNTEIFREYDIRGVYDGDFDDQFAHTLGRAFVTYLAQKGQKNPVITVGHDARVSSPALSKAMCEGLQAGGAKVVFLGLVTSPISYFSMFALDNPAGGIMITGSHNPANYNGFKVSVGKTTIYGDEIQVLRQIIEKGQYVEGQGAYTTFDIFGDYVARYQKEFKDLKPIKVVLDCGNGVAGCIVRRLFEGVGLKPIILFEEPDGRFPNHHPDPTVEKNLTDLKKAVLEHKADIGIGFDGDADRIGIVNEKGEFVAGDEMMVIISRGILKDNPGAKIVGDVKCSDRMYDDIRKHGGHPIMWKTGHSLIKTKIKEEKAPFGGELSGHVFFADRNYGYDDALYAGLRLCEIIAKAGQPVSQLLAGFPPAFNTPELRIDTTEDKKRSIVEKLKKTYSHDTDRYKVNMIDGVRISYNDGWALARASNTQPVLVMRFESTTAEGLKRIQNEIESIVNPLL